VGEVKTYLDQHQTAYDSLTQSIQQLSQKCQSLQKDNEIHAKVQTA